MTKIQCRPAELSDIPSMAAIRAGDWGTQEYWQNRIKQYLTGELHPKQALRPRAAFVVVQGERMVGLVAGHRTRRFRCDGELEWISVIPGYRRRGIARELLHRMAEWFVEQRAFRICVDVEPSNEVARRFYARTGAEDLKPHWMVWPDVRRALHDRKLVRRG